jgi:urate oxidase
MKTPPIRLVLYAGSDSRRDLADLLITAGFNEHAKPEAESVDRTIRAVTGERRYQDLEGLALLLAHRLLDAEPTVTKVDVEVAAQSWRRLGTHAFERGSQEVRMARACVNRDGSAAVSAAIRGLKLMMGEPAFESADLEWRYKAAGAAGVSYNSSWSAVRKMALQAFDDREEPHAIAQLLVDLIEAVAEVRLTIETETLSETGVDGLFESSGVVKRHTVTAQAR